MTRLMKSSIEEFANVSKGSLLLRISGGTQFDGAPSTPIVNSRNLNF